MADFLLSKLQLFLAHFTYLALLIVLLAAGVGVPIPEDVPLMTAGYLCHPEASPINDLPVIDTDGDGKVDAPNPDGQPQRIPHVSLMIIAGMIGVLTGDVFVFFVGRNGIDSSNIVARHLRKVLHSERRARAEKHFAKHGYLTVFAGRFMPGFRSLIFAMAGMSKMSLPRFLLIDSLAAGISVPTFVILGYHFAPHINKLFHYVSETKSILTYITLPLLAIAIALYLLRKKKRAAADAAASAIAVSPRP